MFGISTLTKLVSDGPSQLTIFEQGLAVQQKLEGARGYLAAAQEKLTTYQRNWEDALASGRGIDDAKVARAEAKELVAEHTGTVAGLERQLEALQSGATIATRKSAWSRVDAPVEERKRLALSISKKVEELATAVVKFNELSVELSRAIADLAPAHMSGVNPMLATNQILKHLDHDLQRALRKARGDTTYSPLTESLVARLLAGDQMIANIRKMEGAE